jgi:hypothetical protein
LRPSDLNKYTFLGFDISDWGLISGLSNCGLDPDETLTGYRHQWGPRLNRHHLFDNYNDAHRFTGFSDRRVPEHAPFFVFGLWCRTD